VDEKVLAEFLQVEQDCHGNALSAHGLGRTALETMERATKGIASLIGVSPKEIIYTSGASEANNLAIKGIARAYAHKGKHILSTCLEHPSVSGTLAYLQQLGYEIELLKIQQDGKIDLAHLKNVIRTSTILLCVSAVDSELGAIQNLQDIAQLVKQYPHCYLHVDAAQAVGKIPIEVNDASTFCFSPHKFYGLCGFGVLVKREGVVLEPLIHGGAGSLYRSGTPSPAMAAACFKALEIALDEQEMRLKTVKSLRKYVLDNINLRINSPKDGSPYILNLSAKGLKGANFQAMLDSRGIAVSVKSACSTDKSPSRPVFAVSGDRKNALESWRVSFSHHTTIQELDEFLGAVVLCANSL